MELNIELIRETKGFLDHDEGLRLYEIALEASRFGPCLEIGSYCGKSTIYLGTACRVNRSVLFTIDHHRGSEEQQPGEAYFDPELFDERSRKIDTFPFLRNTLSSANIEDSVAPIVCRSEVAARMWGTPLSLVFIDGSHTYESAFIDYNAWSRHIIPNGYLIIHDIFTDPDKGGQAPYHIYRLALASGLYEELERVKTLGVLRKRGCRDLPDDLPR